MKYLLVLSMAIGLSACTSSTRNTYAGYGSYGNATAYKPQTNTSYVKPVAQSSYQASNSQSNFIKTSGQAASPVAVSNFERLSYEDLVRFEPDCEQRTEQIALLEEQLKRNRFYTVDGVDGNSYPGKISKSYYSLAKYRIWSLRFACQGSEVPRNVIEQDVRAVPTSSPLATPRCYFEETTEAKTSVQPAHYLASEQQSTRKEICTNFPYAQDRPFIRIGDQISLSSRDTKDGASYSALRKWKGSIYQMASKTEMHLNQAVRFTLVTVRSGVNQWTVIDKF